MEEVHTNKRAGDAIEALEQQPRTKSLRRLPVNEAGDVILLTREGSLKDEARTFYQHDLHETEEKDATLTLFGRHLGSFRNGDTVLKHCAPWGENLHLHNNEWDIDSKVFDTTEDELLFVVLRRHKLLGPGNNNYYMVNSAFFNGWTDAATRQLAYDAQARDDTKEKVMTLS
jgi:hypothetical protein